MDEHLVVVAVLTTVTIALWASGKLPEHLTALLFFTAATVLTVAPTSVIFSGFTSPAFWLIISGYVMGVALTRTGLAARGGQLIAAHLGSSYRRMVFGTVGMSYALALVMPSSMGRIALLMPVVLALADRAGLHEGSKGRIGLASAVAFATFQLSATVLPANVPNLVMAGAAQDAYGIHLSYLPYLLLHAPVLGVLKGLALAVCLLVLFPDQAQRPAGADSSAPLSPPEKRLAGVLAVTLALWLTEPLHGIAPAWVGLAAACFCLAPRMGFLNGDDFRREVNHATATYVAAVLGLAAVVAHSGLGEWAGQLLARVAPLDPASPFTGFASAVGISALLSLVVTANGVPAVFTPVAAPLAAASGLPLLTVLMAQVVGFSTPVLPYQAPPVVMAMGLAKIPFRAAVSVSASLALVTAVVLVPLDYLWFGLLGKL